MRQLDVVGVPEKNGFRDGKLDPVSTHATEAVWCTVVREGSTTSTAGDDWRDVYGRAMASKLRSGGAVKEVQFVVQLSLARGMLSTYSKGSDYQETRDRAEAQLRRAYEDMSDGIAIALGKKRKPRPLEV